jgi:hypothetical protein
MRAQHNAPRLQLDFGQVVRGAMANEPDDGGEVLEAVPVSIFDEWLKRAPAPVQPAPARKPVLSVGQAALIAFLLGAWLFGRGWHENNSR